MNSFKKNLDYLDFFSSTLKSIHSKISLLIYQVAKKLQKRNANDLLLNNQFISFISDSFGSES